jgi:hypothetical protein
MNFTLLFFLPFSLRSSLFYPFPFPSHKSCTLSLFLFPICSRNRFIYLFFTAINTPLIMNSLCVLIAPFFPHNWKRERLAVSHFLYSADRNVVKLYLQFPLFSRLFLPLLFSFPLVTIVYFRFFFSHPRRFT